jgi:hypothetical protein
MSCETRQAALIWVRPQSTSSSPKQHIPCQPSPLGAVGAVCKSAGASDDDRGRRAGGQQVEPSGTDILTSVRDRDRDLLKTSGSVQDWDRAPGLGLKMASGFFVFIIFLIWNNRNLVNLVNLRLEHHVCVFSGLLCSVCLNFIFVSYLLIFTRCDRKAKSPSSSSSSSSDRFRIFRYCDYARILTNLLLLDATKSHLVYGCRVSSSSKTRFLVASSFKFSGFSSFGFKCLSDGDNFL